MADAGPEPTSAQKQEQDMKMKARVAEFKLSLAQKAEMAKGKSNGENEETKQPAEPKISEMDKIMAKFEARIPRLTQPWTSNLAEYKKPPAKVNKTLVDFTTIYVLGSESSGKTTLINRLLEKTEVPKPTFALDYSFARRTVQSSVVSDYPEKEVCNIWELGGDAYKYPTLVASPVLMRTHSLDKMAIFLILDLSEPESLWPTLDVAVKELKRGVTQALANNLRDNKEDVTKKLEENIVKRLGSDFSDKKYLEPFPLPIVMICTKFDLFQNFEPERRKQVSRILRLASHRLGASLNYFSKNDVSHSRRVRELFTHYAFGTRFPKDICHDFNKGLQIPHGGDSYEQIWPGSNPSQFTFDYFKHLYESQVGKIKGKESKDNISVIDDNSFREPSVDSQRNILKEELRMMENSFRDFGKIGFNLIRKF